MLFGSCNVSCVDKMADDSCLWNYLPEVAENHKKRKKVERK